MHDSGFIDMQTNNLIKSLKKLTNNDYELVTIESLYDADLALILVESGGSEHYFLEVKDQLKEPIYLLTFGNNNSLAASLEILTYIQNNKMQGEILHGSDRYIADRINEILKRKDNG